MSETISSSLEGGVAALGSDDAAPRALPKLAPNIEPSDGPEFVEFSCFPALSFFQPDPRVNLSPAPKMLPAGLSSFFGVTPKLDPTSIVDVKEAAGVVCLKMLPPPAVPLVAAAAAAKPPELANEAKPPPEGVGVAVEPKGDACDGLPKAGLLWPPRLDA